MPSSNKIKISTLAISSLKSLEQSYKTIKKDNALLPESLATMRDLQDTTIPVVVNNVLEWLDERTDSKGKKVLSRAETSDMKNDLKVIQTITNNFIALSEVSDLSLLDAKDFRTQGIEALLRIRASIGTTEKALAQADATEKARLEKKFDIAKEEGGDVLKDFGGLASLLESTEEAAGGETTDSDDYLDKIMDGADEVIKQNRKILKNFPTSKKDKRNKKAAILVRAPIVPILDYPLNTALTDEAGIATEKMAGYSILQEQIVLGVNMPKATKKMGKVDAYKVAVAMLKKANKRMGHNFILVDDDPRFHPKVKHFHFFWVMPEKQHSVLTRRGSQPLGLDDWGLAF